MIKNIYGIWLLLIFVCSCNNVIDTQKPDTETVPEETIYAIKNQYPDADQFVFKTLIKEKLWRARFSSQTDKFETLVRSKAILGDVFKNTSDISLYKGLTDKLKISGGTISNVQRIEKSVDSGSRMKYILNGRPQLLNYSLLNELHVIKLVAPYPEESYPAEISDLPKAIVTFCSQNKIDINSSDIKVNEDKEGKKTYLIHPDAELFPIFFNHEGNLIWIAKNSNGVPVENKPNDKVGNAEILEKIKGEYTDFNVVNALAFETRFGDLNSVRYVFQRKSGQEGTRSFISETQEMFVNENSGEIIFEQYSSYVYK